jgi:hypothetical protein
MNRRRLNWLMVTLLSSVVAFTASPIAGGGSGTSEASPSRSSRFSQAKLRLRVQSRLLENLGNADPKQKGPAPV